MTYPFTITYKNGKQNTVWIEAENENDANEYSLNYWSDPEVTGIAPFVEPEDQDELLMENGYFEADNEDNLPANWWLNPNDY